MRLAAVMVGGTVGALARWAVELAVPSVGGFPLATFLINVTGAFGLGLIGVILLERLPPTRHLRPLLLIGFFGAYTPSRPWPRRASGCCTRAHSTMAVGYWVSTLLVGQMAGVYGMWLGRLRPPRRRDATERRSHAGADLHR